MVLIVGCGRSDPTLNKTNSANIAPVSSQTRNVGKINMPPSSIPALSTTLHGLRLVGQYSCTFNQFSGTNIVLAQSVPSNYDSDTMIKINEYLASILDASKNSTLVKMPTALQNVLGGGCSAWWEITNIGASAVELSGVRFLLTESTQQNNYRYRLIGLLCTAYPNLCGAGQGPPLSATINLTNAKAGTSFTGKFSESTYGVSQVNPANGTLILNSNSTVGIEIYFRSSGKSGNLIYSGDPEILLDTSSGVQPIQLPQVTLVFANSSQFSCFILQKDGFTPAAINDPNLNSVCI
jgi:hypothetical protein